jgi:hypothetical protein
MENNETTAGLVSDDPAWAWWGPAGLRSPFTPGRISGNNDGKVRDAAGEVIADCNGSEARADVIAALLNRQADLIRQCTKL